MRAEHVLSEPYLRTLAPLHLVSYHSRRYNGDGLSVSLNTFGRSDQHLLRDLYGYLSELYQLVQAHMDEPERCIAQLRRGLTRTQWRSLVARVRTLGEDVAEPAESERLSKVIHDLRGGAFQTLVVQFELLERGKTQRDSIERVGFLVRDHLKIMRNAVPDLDPEGYDRDRRDNLHSINLLIEKWHHARHEAGGRSAQVEVACYFAGNVSERCLEFAALDRVVYNLVNNAVRHTADDRVYLGILPIPPERHRDLRFVVANRITGEQQRLLTTRYGQSLGGLFEGGFTTGGAGLGMRICADFVLNAYGVRSVLQGVEGGYLGARLVEGYFIAWFHWPIAAG